MGEWTISWLTAEIRARRISPIEATELCIERTRRLDGHLRAFINLDAAAALQTAKALELEAVSNRWRGRLHGIVLGFKDIVHIGGFPTSCGTSTPNYFVADQDCTAVRCLRDAGAITLGKLNMSELAMGPFGENRHHGNVQNPWRAEHCAGGSSSGSAAAVAAGLVLGALGSDTGGSIRVPAACCGIVGLKPTYGRVSRAGAMPLSWSMDHVGPMARTVRDVALLLQLVSGYDQMDATSSQRTVPDYVAALKQGVAGLRIGVPKNYYFQALNSETEAGVRDVILTCERLGARPQEIQLPDPQVICDVTNIIARCESAAIHTRRLTERPHELEPSTRSRFEQGRHISAYDYLQALRLRARLARQFVREVFAEVDALITPTIPEPAPVLAQAISGAAAEVTSKVLQFTRMCRPFNGLGLPALSVPCGFSSQGLPLAFQLVGRPFDEATVLRIGHAYEEATRWYQRRPPEAAETSSAP